MRDCFLVYDLLSSGASVVIFTKEGELLTSAYRPFKVYFDGSKAWQPAGMWWECAVQTTREVLQKVDASRIAGISFTAQGMVCLCVDEHGNALHDAITCQDNRAGECTDILAERMSDEEYYSITGLQSSAGSSIHKLMWVKKYMPEVYEKTYKMIQCKDYLALQLTGQFYTDYTDANIAGALDLSTWDWSDKILAAAGIERDKMPSIAQSSAVIGEVTAKAAGETGLHEGTPVIMGVGDVAGSALGAGLARLGQVYMSLGSSSWIAQCRETAMFGISPYIINSIHPIPHTYLCFVPSQETGIVFKWLKNEIFRYDTDRKRDVEPFLNVYPYTGMGEQVLRSPIGAGGVMCYPYVYRYGDSDIGGPGSHGAFVGLKWTNTREDMMRAALEGACFELKNKLDFFRRDYCVNEITIVGGASNEKVWLQIMADIFDVKIQNTTLTGSADAVGAAVVIGNALGIYSGFDEARRFWKSKDTFVPDLTAAAKYREIHNIYMAGRPAIDAINYNMQNGGVLTQS